MRKFVSIALALVMVLALSVTCFAVTMNAPGSESAEVKVSYIDGAAAPATRVIEIAWGDLSFEYTQAPQKWDEEQHKEVDDGVSGWTKGEATITVTNHSNVAVNAQIVYAAGTASGTAVIHQTGGAQTDLAAATPAAQAALEATLTASGIPAEDAANTVVGTVTVTIS